MENMSNNNPSCNEAVFKAILQDLEKDAKGRIGQPQLIVGSFGSGKTTIMRQLYDAVCSDSVLKPVWIDGRTVFSTDEILVGNEVPRSVLFVDDFNYYLQRVSSPQQYVLRGALSQKDAPILIASVPAIMPQLSNYGSAFFEGFRIHYLQPVSDDELRLIIDGTESQYERARALMAYLPKTPSAALMTRGIIMGSKSKSEDISILVKRMSALYQFKFDNLPPQQQRIMCALAGEDLGINLSALRDKTGQEASMLSPYITQMLDRGIITKEVKSTRGGVYRIADKVFSLWLNNYNF